MMRSPVTDQEVRAAWAAAWAFWRALQDDEEDEAFLERLSPDARAYLAETPGGVGTEASGIRGVLDVELATIALLGTRPTIELYEGPICRFWFLPTGPIGLRIEPGVDYVSWRLDLELHDGRWLVHPWKRDRGPSIGYATIESTPPPAGRA